MKKRAAMKPVPNHWEGDGEGLHDVVEMLIGRKPLATKTASNWAHAAEVAGLGILAKPSIDEWRGKKVPGKKKAKTEIAGLGVLAAPAAYSLGKHFLTKHAHGDDMNQELMYGAFADELEKIAELLTPLAKAMVRKSVGQVAAAAPNTGRALTKLTGGVKSQAIPAVAPAAKKTFDPKAFFEAKKSQGAYQGLGLNKPATIK